jgi:threonine/homoserine/homoserine lactone efflux protein
MEFAIPSAAHIGAFAAAGFVLLLVPGPAVLYIVGRSVEQGRLAGVVSVLGITTGTLVHVTAAVVGLSALITSSVLAFSIVKYAGAAYLIYIGVRRLLSRGDSPADPVNLPRRSPVAPVQRRLHRQSAQSEDGAVLPGLPAAMVEAAKGGVPSQIAFLGLLFAGMGLFSDGTYALLAGTAGSWMRRRRGFLKAERYVTGGVFIGLGLTAAIAGNGRK